MNFDNFSTDDIIDETQRALGFHISAAVYLEEESPRFTDVTDLELNTEPTVVDNPGQVVTNSKEEVVKKKNKRTAKRKMRLAKLRILGRSSLSPYLKSSPLLSTRFVPAPVSAFVPALMPALVPAHVPTPMPTHVSTLVPAFLPALMHAPMPALISRPRSPALLSSRHVLVFHCRIPALLSPLPGVLDPPLPLGSSLFRTFKRFLSDKPQLCVSTNPTKPLRLFPALGAYNPINNNKRKRSFHIVFINSCLLTNNHDQKR